MRSGCWQTFRGFSLRPHFASPIHPEHTQDGRSRSPAPFAAAHHFCRFASSFRMALVRSSWPSGRAESIQHRGAQCLLEFLAGEERVEHGAALPAGGRRHRRLHCRPPGGRNRGGLVQKRPVHPVGHLGGVVGLSPEIEEGHAEVGRQLVLLVLGGGLAARLKLFNRRAGEAQGGGKSRTAQPLAVRSSSMRCAKVTIKICLLAECLLYPVPAALSMRRDFSFGCGCDMIAVQRRS